MRKVTVTNENIDDLWAQIREGACDQADELAVGQEIETWPITYKGGQRGQMTVWRDTDRAALCLGGPSIWGEWDAEARILRTDEGVEYDEEGERLGWTAEEVAWGRQHWQWGTAEASGDDDLGARCIAEAIMEADGGGWGAATERADSLEDFLNIILASEDLDGVEDPRVIREIRAAVREAWAQMEPVPPAPLWGGKGSQEGR